MRRSWLLSGLLALSAGCGEGASEGAPSSLDTLDEQASVDAPVADVVRKVDLLFVLDPSHRAYLTQNALGRAVGPFLERLDGIDLRVGVIVSSGPELLHRVSHEFNCCFLPNVVFPCDVGPEGDQACREQFGERWVCSGPAKAEQVRNCNGSINSGCMFACTSDWDCDQELLGMKQGQACKADNARCVYDCLINGPHLSACAERPSTADCPPYDEIHQMLTTGAGLESGHCPDGSLCASYADCADEEPCAPAPAFVTPATVDLLHCTTVPGTWGSPNPRLQRQGFNAALDALDRDGPYGYQAQAFLRDDALLVLVFIGLTDDCSTEPGETLQVEGGPCACLKDSSQGGPLRPIPEIASALETLAPAPDRLLLATITGDSMAPDPASKEADRARTLDSACGICSDPEDAHSLLGSTGICVGPLGKAFPAPRHRALVDALGDRARSFNLCEEGALPSALEAMATLILDRS